MTLTDFVEHLFKQKMIATIDNLKISILMLYPLNKQAS